MTILQKPALVFRCLPLTNSMSVFHDQSALSLFADLLLLLSERFNSLSSMERRRLFLGEVDQAKHLLQLGVKADLRDPSRWKRGAEIDGKVQQMGLVGARWILVFLLSLSRLSPSLVFPRVWLNTVLEPRCKKLNMACVKAIAIPVCDQTEPKTSEDFGTVASSRVQQEASSEKVKESLSGICSMCMEDVRTKKFLSERRYGLLESCEHAFCYGCIRKACGVSELDVVSGSVDCPTCCTRSEIVAASSSWLVGQDKVTFFNAFRDSFRGSMKEMFAKYRAEWSGQMLFKAQNDLTYGPRWKFTEDQPVPADDTKWKFTEDQPVPADDTKWKFTEYQPVPADDTKWKFTEYQPVPADDTKWKFTEYQPVPADDAKWMATKDRENLTGDSHKPLVRNSLPFVWKSMTNESRRNSAYCKKLWITEGIELVWGTNSKGSRCIRPKGHHDLSSEKVPVHKGQGCRVFFYSRQFLFLQI